MIPSALASLADTSPTFFNASVSHEQERARVERLTEKKMEHQAALGFILLYENSVY